MSTINIFRASAGSGKTFTLTREYLLILFQNPYSFKHILAVTFTNKACAEMKGRIIEQLHALASGRSSPYFKILGEYFGIDEASISARASEILNLILNNYSFFNIKTIDTFFQGIVVNFAKELGIFSIQNIELNNKKMLEKAISHLFINIDDYPDLKIWLNDYVMNQINLGENYDVRRKVMKLCDNLFNEGVSSLISSSNTFFDDKPGIDALYNKLETTVNTFEAEMKRIGQQGQAAIEHSGLDLSDFYYGKNGFINLFPKILSGDYEPNSRARNVLEGEKYWYSDKSKRKADVVALMNDKILDLVRHYLDMYDNTLVDYNTALCIVKYRHIFPVISKLAAKVLDYCSENNIRLLSNNNMLLKNLINDNPVPFVYEKTGVYLHHLMLDEFQDTSEIQWSNLKPLVENCLAEHNHCLVVGDVKQSIYRWRNGDWTLLGNRIFDNFGGRINMFALDTNFRSAPRVIEFNNLFFNTCRQTLHDKIDEELAYSGVALPDFLVDVATKVYNDVEQLCPPGNSREGYVAITYNIRNELEDSLFTWLPENIEKLQKSGIDASEIAIVVRKNDECKKIINNLLAYKHANPTSAYCFDAVSADGLELQNSPAVMILVALIAAATNKNDLLSRAFVVQEYAMKFEGKSANEVSIENKSFEQFLYQHNLELHNHLPLYEFCELVMGKLSLSSPGEIPFLKDFMDIVLEFTMKNNGQATAFIEWWNENGKQKTIAQPEGQHAMHVITIHKSKGLQFKAVIIPYCTWDLTNMRNTILWTDSPQLDFPFHPVDFNKRLSQSRLKQEYITELIQQYIDNINLLYVAFTRAEDVLLINTTISAVSSFTTVADFLVHLKPSNSDTIEFGMLPPAGEVEKNNTNIITQGVCHFESFEASVAVKFATHDIEELANTTSRSSHRATGTMMHEILAKIEKPGDVTRVVSESVIDGAITSNQAHDIERLLSRALDDPATREWFDGSHEVLTETRVIDQAGNIKRPDRVLLKGKTAKIIDYKFSEPSFYETHKHQVKEYMDIFETMGYETQGFIWYINNQLIRAV